MASFLFILLISIPLSTCVEQYSQSENITRDSSSNIQLQTYIVQLFPSDHVAHRLSNTERESLYSSLLSKTVGESPASRLVHSYHHVFPGFAARLTPEEFEAVQRMEGVVSAWPSQKVQLLTTHSPEFMGLKKDPAAAGEDGFWRDVEFGAGVIVGVLDSGINADHPSFTSGNVKNPPPAKWRGKCEAPIKCNNKLIGARSFVPNEPSPRDGNGHGTHVAGIAVGNFVEDANVHGEGHGTASGIAPNAYLAVYKVCNRFSTASGSSILAGFDAAIADGVDIINVSLGPELPETARPFDRDGAAIGAFSALKRGIFVSVSAGNAGPSKGSVGNEAPWYLSVGASTTDRDIEYGIQSVLQRNSRLNTTSYGNRHAPVVWRHSSRGPTTKARGIVKPDVVGPGVDIISASYIGSGFDIMSGTSMASPHLAGAAALVKARHSEWSPAFIRSALTTSTNKFNGYSTLLEDEASSGYAGVLEMGSGQVQVRKAINPKLVFNIEPRDYIPYLCSLGDYSSQQVTAIVTTPVDCAKFPKTSPSALNYPSITFDLRNTPSQTISRTLTYVGTETWEYLCDFYYVIPGAERTVYFEVYPRGKSYFSEVNMNKTFQVTATRKENYDQTGVVDAFLLLHTKGWEDTVSVPLVAFM